MVKVNQSSDDDYTEKRTRNNKAVQKSRQKSRTLEKETLERVEALRKENAELEQREQVLTKELQFLKDMFIAYAVGNPKGPADHSSQKDLGQILGTSFPSGPDSFDSSQNDSVTPTPSAVGTSISANAATVSRPEATTAVNPQVVQIIPGQPTHFQLAVVSEAPHTLSVIVPDGPTSSDHSHQTVVNHLEAVPLETLLTGVEYSFADLRTPFPQVSSVSQDFGPSDSGIVSLKQEYIPSSFAAPVSSDTVVLSLDSLCSSVPRPSQAVAHCVPASRSSDRIADKKLQLK